MSNDSRLIHTIESKDYVIYSFPYYKEIFRVGIDTVFALPRAYLDESNGVVLIPNSARRLVMFKPDVMTDIPKFGFVWSKDTVYTEEQLNFRALTNIEGSKYEWKFSNGEIINSDTNEITHKFLVPDIYGVTLEVIKPDGEKISFVKDSIITVLEIVKADFEATELNSELPLRVQFTDKSNGANTSWTWDFGDGESSTEQNPVYEYKYAGDFSPRLIVSDGIDKDTIIKYEYVINAIPNPIVNVSDKNLHLKTGMTEFQKSFLTDNGINLSWTKHYFIPNGFLNYGDYYAEIFSRNFSFDFAIIDTFAYNHRSSNSFNVKLFHLLLKDKLVFNYNKSEFGITSYNFKDKRLFANKNSKLGAASVILNNIDSTFFWVSNLIVNASVIKTDYDFNIISELSIPPNAKQYLADTLDNGLNLIIREQNNTYSYFSISPENTLNYEQSFSLDTNITLSGIKSVNDNLILLHGFYKDKVNKTTYAYFAKYHPLDNTIQDTILYSRKDIRKIERVNNSTFAAIGQSRGRQGYLLLDTNLHQIKDIRVDSLTGEIKDMILHDKKVYIFTEKIVSLPTMALGANESYQTTASVLAIPEVIIDTVKDTTVISIDKLTHSAYPNPTNEVLNLKVATHQAANYTIKLYDIFGTEILNIHDGYIPANSEKIFSISTSSLSIGSYYYVISGGGLVERGKVLIIR